MTTPQLQLSDATGLPVGILGAVSGRIVAFHRLFQAGMHSGRPATISQWRLVDGGSGMVFEG